MDPILAIVDSLYSLRVYKKEEIKNLINSIKVEKNKIRNIDLELIEELLENSVSTIGGEYIIEKKMKFIDEFIKFLIYWYKKETT